MRAHARFLLSLAMALQTTQVQAKVINDSLVENLSCRSLSSAAIYKAIKTEAFGAQNHFMKANWPFSVGFTQIAGCWALSRAQRLSFYLGRWNERSDVSADQRTEHVLNMFRGSVPSTDSRSNQEHGAPVTAEMKYKNYAVFKAEEESMRRSWMAGTQSLWSDLMTGFTQGQGRDAVKRNFVTDIQHYQAQRFFRFGNLGMGIGTSVGTPKENYELVKKLMTAIRINQLPMVNLRASRTVQHIVVLKSFVLEPSGDVLFKMYDSNAPTREHILVYNAQKGMFNAPDVFKYLFTDGTSSRDLGVFLVDHEEHETISAALLDYYKNECSK